MDIQELSQVFDPESRATFVSLYFDGKDPKFIRRRAQAVRSALPSDLQEHFELTLQDMTDYLDRQSGGNVAIFASRNHQFFKAVSLTEPPTNTLVVDSSPYIRPLAALDDKWEGFTLVLMNSHHAKIYAVACSAIAEETELSQQVMNKHKKGGMSQARFQRLRTGSIHRFYQDLEEALETLDVHNIILAGPGEAKHQFRNHLPPTWQQKVVAVIDAPPDQKQELWQESIAAMAAHDDQIKHHLMEQLKKEILTDGLAVYGIQAVTQAAQSGQADTVFIETGHRHRGWLCERCQRLEEGTATVCPSCKNPVATVDVLEEIIEFAQRTDAHVTFVDHELLNQVGHVAALLRYKI